MPDNENEAAPVAEKPKRTRTKKLDMVAALVGSMETIAGQTAGASGVTFDPPEQDAYESVATIEPIPDREPGMFARWYGGAKRTIADMLGEMHGAAFDPHLDAAAAMDAADAEVQAIAAAAHLKLPAGADDWYRRGATGQAGPVRRQVGFGHAGAIYQDDFPNRQAYRAACALWRSGRQWAIREGRTFTTRETA